MIVRNEADVIARCLASFAPVVDEIVIVDTGSSDETVKIASEFTDKIYRFEWIDDFAAARNFAFSKGTCSHLMWADADDVLPQSQQEAFLRLKQTLDPDADVVYLDYTVAFDGSGRPILSFLRERIVKNDGSFRWEGAVHEVIPPHGKLFYAPTRIEHRPVEKAARQGRNLAIYRKKLAADKRLSTRDQFYYARELMFNGLYEDSVDAFRLFLTAPDGWNVNRVEAARNLSGVLLKLGRKEEALSALTDALGYMPPAGELCCEIGNFFFNENRLPDAAFWYLLATTLKPNRTGGAFINEDCYGYIPYLQLCVVYYRLGRIDDSIDCNEKALALKPESPECKQNRLFFDRLKQTPPSESSEECGKAQRLL